MRRIAIVMPLLALGAAEPAMPPVPAIPSRATVIAPAFPDCRNFHIAHADRKAAFRRLGELPPAEAYHAVLRAGPDGCPDPLLVSERINWPRQKSAK